MRCAIYARYSSDLQRETSIEDQIRKCRAFADAQGWIVLDPYVRADHAFQARPSPFAMRSTASLLKPKRNRGRSTGF
jgi:DNA invertase Pin-like site-specific DNA recombinase